MAINIGGKPLAGFSGPLDMMKDCHRRIEHFLDELREAERRFGESELEEEGRLALEASLNYFANFAPRHTADEEQSLFPRMRRSRNEEARSVMADLDRLENDHRGCEALQALVDRVVRNWLETGRLDGTQRERLRAALDGLANVYTAHIQLEDARVFAVALRILNPEQIRDIGEEMRKRRSISSLSNAVARSFEQEQL